MSNEKICSRCRYNYRVGKGKMRTTTNWDYTDAKFYCGCENSEMHGAMTAYYDTCDEWESKSWGT